MQDLGLPPDMPEPILMPPHLDRVTKSFWNWFYNDIAHHPLGIQRQGTWHETIAVEEVAAFGGLGYQWSLVHGVSHLTLWTPPGVYKRTRTAVTAEELPPFSLVTRCWFDLCRDMSIIGTYDWETATAQLDRFKRYEARQYGDCW
jgi:hypothetical protein